MIIVNKFNTSQMKKYIIGSLAIATIAIAGWNFNQKSEVQLTDLALDNVEALASGESGGVNNKALAQKPNGSYCCAPLNGNSCYQSPDC